MNKVEFAAQWQRLLDAYPTSRKVPPVDEVYNIIGRSHENTFAAAVTELISSEEFFPSIHKIKRAVIESSPNKGKEYIRNPGPGFVAMDAAKHNQCTAILDPGGSDRQAVVCGVELTGDVKSPSPYLCMGHYKYRQIYNEQFSVVKSTQEVSDENF